jgi:hypothetical protein
MLLTFTCRETFFWSRLNLLPFLWLFRTVQGVRQIYDVLTKLNSFPGPPTLHCWPGPPPAVVLLPSRLRVVQEQLTKDHTCSRPGKWSLASLGLAEEKSFSSHGGFHNLLKIPLGSPSLVASAWCSRSTSDHLQTRCPEHPMVTSILIYWWPYGIYWLPYGIY